VSEQLDPIIDPPVDGSGISPEDDLVDDSLAVSEADTMDDTMDDALDDTADDLAAEEAEPIPFLTHQNSIKCSRMRGWALGGKWRS